MKFVRFVLLVLLNYLFKYVAMAILAFMPLYSNEDIWDYTFDFACLIFALIVILIFLWVLKLIIKNSQLNNIWKNKIIICLKIFLIFILFESKFINLLYPVFYYYFFKMFLSKVALIKEFYLNYASVKKYAYVYFILESPFILFLILIEIFERSSEPNYWMIVYLLTSSFIFYLPFFVLSWWDNRKLQNNNHE